MNVTRTDVRQESLKGQPRKSAYEFAYEYACNSAYEFAHEYACNSAYEFAYEYAYDPAYSSACVPPAIQPAIPPAVPPAIPTRSQPWVLRRLWMATSEGDSK